MWREEVTRADVEAVVIVGPADAAEIVPGVGRADVEQQVLASEISRTARDRGLDGIARSDRAGAGGGQAILGKRAPPLELEAEVLRRIPVNGGARRHAAVGQQARILVPAAEVA